MRYNLRHTSLLPSITTAAITSVDARRSGKFCASAASAINAPNPTVLILWPAKITYSDTMLAFHAPPVAVINPVTRYGKIAGMISNFHRRQPVSPYTPAASLRSDGIAIAPAITLNRTYHCVPSTIRAMAAMLRPPGSESSMSRRTENSAVAGIDAMTCTTGCNLRDHLGLIPTATPNGTVHAVAMISAASVRPKVASVATNMVHHVLPVRPDTARNAAKPPQMTIATAARPRSNPASTRIHRGTIGMERLRGSRGRSSDFSMGATVWSCSHATSEELRSRSSIHDSEASPPDCSNLNLSDHATSGRQSI